MKIYNLLFETVISNESDHSNPETSFVSPDNKTNTNILKDNTSYYVFAGGTKPFHAGHDMLLSKIIQDAKSDPKNSVACFFIGLGNRRGGPEQIEIRGDQVKRIWKEVVEKRLEELSGSGLTVYVEYGGGPVIKARSIIQAINSGTITGSKITIYGDPDDSRGNYLTPTYYKRDETQSSIDKKRLTNPAYKGYEKGQFSKSSPHFDLSNLRVASSPEQSEGSYDLVFPGLVNPNTAGERITSGTEMRRAAFSGDVEGFISGLPDFVKSDPRLTKIYLDEFMPNRSLTEIKRAEKGTEAYSNYLEELMDELQHVKSSYESRKKTGQRYRKEASKIQDAYSELRRLKKKNDRKLNAQTINEVVNIDGYNTKVIVTDNHEYSRDDAKEFFRKFKK